MLEQFINGICNHYYNSRSENDLRKTQLLNLLQIYYFNFLIRNTPDINKTDLDIPEDRIINEEDFIIIVSLFLERIKYKNLKNTSSNYKFALQYLIKNLNLEFKSLNCDKNSSICFQFFSRKSKKIAPIDSSVVIGGVKTSKKVIKERAEKKFRKNLGKSSVIIKDYKISYDKSKIKMKKDGDNCLILTKYRQVLVVDKKRNVLNLSKPQKYSKDLLEKKYKSKKVSLDMYKDFIKFPKFVLELKKNI